MRVASCSINQDPLNYFINYRDCLILTQVGTRVLANFNLIINLNPIILLFLNLDSQSL